MTSKSLWRALTISLLLFIVLEPTHAAAQGIILYGTCTLGGNSDSGTIFEYFVANDSLVKVYDFGGSNGSSPSGRLLQASDGKLYGVTNNGGAFNTGVLFQFDPITHQYNKKHDFASTDDENKGGLIQFGNKLYGLGGGITGAGDIYSYDIATDTFMEEYDFDSTADGDGSGPHGDLTLFNNKLYGVTWYDGLNSGGVLFQYDPSSLLYTELFDFDNNNFLGEFPTGKITVANNGKLYLMNTALGTLLEYDPINDTVIKKYEFSSSLFPTGSLLLAADGNLYGFVDSGIGNSYANSGILFEYVPGSDSISVKYGLDSTYTTNGPGANLMQATNGLLYCADETVYSFDYNTNTYTILRAFNDSIGSYPFNGLIQVDLTLGIENVKTANNLSLYPNPASNEVTIENVSSKQNAQVSITDITGRTLTTNYTTLADKIAIDIHTLAPGIYLVELKQDNVNYTGRFVKMD